jgi:hypothetical protein
MQCKKRKTMRQRVNANAETARASHAGDEKKSGAVRHPSAQSFRDLFFDATPLIASSNDAIRAP